MDRENVDALVNRAYVLWQLSKPDEADRDIARAIELQPECGAAYHLDGLLKTDVGNHDAAVDSFSTACQLHADWVEPRRSMAAALSFCGNFEQAVVQYDRVLAIAGLEPQLLFERGLVLLFSGCYDGAISDFSKAISGDPRFWDAFFHRACALRALGRTDDAADDFRRVSKGKRGLPVACRLEQECRTK